MIQLRWLGLVSMLSWGLGSMRLISRALGLLILYLRIEFLINSLKILNRILEYNNPRTFKKV